jgi:UDP-glucuronate 4-epimerase
MTILVIGAAGFIGFHVARALCARGAPVVGTGNLNDYYDVSLKKARLELLNGERDFRFRKLDLADREGIDALFAAQRFSTVINLAG